MKLSGIVTILKSFYQKVHSIGITDDLSFDEKKRTGLLNLIALAGFPACLVFAIINTFQHRYPLVAINICMALGSLAILFINKERKYMLGRFLLSVMSIVTFTVAALFYKNGAEYFLLLNIVATVILFKDNRYVIPISVVNAVLFILIKALNPALELSTNAVPSTRIILNISWTVVFIIIALHYYRNEQLNYQQQVEDSNQQLKQQQEQLLAQKNELEKKTKQLEILNHTKEKLFSVIAHDMRTPIAGLKGTLDLLQNKVISKDEFAEMSKQLSTQVDHLYNNLDNLLQWSYSQLNGIQAKSENAPLKPLVLQTISLLLQNAKQKHLHIEQKVPEGLVVLADPNHTKVIIRNLLSNAIKFSHAHERIEISARQLDHHVEIEVKDHGVGMSLKNSRQLFTTEINSTQRGTQNEKGTGLGLALCKEFVEKNKGNISVESEEGKGTCSTFTLPLKA